MINIFLINFIIVFLLTFVLCRAIIPILSRRKIGQNILEIGPKWHLSKAGTPTMGGICFIASTAISTIIFAMFCYSKNIDIDFRLFVLIVSYALLNGAIGIADDILKRKKHKNEGLKAITKFSLQAVLAITFLLVLNKCNLVDTSINFSILSLSVELGPWYYILAFFALTGFVNAVNLTDGIDGLATSVSATVGIFILIVAYMQGNVILGFFGTSLTSAMLAFLLFNKYPAKVFMGDTGSLFLGGMISGISFAFNNFLIIILFGFVYLLEAISVIMQVIYFKLSKGKRLFKMAPLHHHLEKSGWSEPKIVVTLSLINILFCVIAFVFLL